LRLRAETLATRRAGDLWRWWITGKLRRTLESTNACESMIDTVRRTQRSFCVDSGSKHAKQAGETDERLFAVAVWREAPYFTDAERAALALAEAVTRLSDREDPVPNKIWEEAARHYDERGLAALTLWIATTNVFNRLNVTTRQPVGSGEW
jgi:alkylhydroperoxidase family enzyme